MRTNLSLFAAIVQLLTGLLMVWGALWMYRRMLNEVIVSVALLTERIQRLEKNPQ